MANTTKGFMVITKWIVYNDFFCIFHIFWQLIPPGTCHVSAFLNKFWRPETWDYTKSSKTGIYRRCAGVHHLT